MMGALDGFLVLAAVVALGACLAAVGVIDGQAHEVLSRLAFQVASPALVLTVLVRTETSGIFDARMVATASATCGVAIAFALVAWWLLRLRGEELVVATLAASYVNAGNLGLPVAAYVLGDVSLVVPTLVLQLLVLQPVAVSTLDVLQHPHIPLAVRRLLSRPMRNPLTVCTLVGLLISVSPLHVPSLVLEPFEVVAGMAVPAMLLAYGAFLRLAPPASGGVRIRVLVCVLGLKLCVHPFLAFAAGRWWLGLEGTDLLAVTICAALPTAHNVFLVATQYRTSVTLVRDVILWGTALAAPLLVALSAVMS